MPLIVDENGQEYAEVRRDLFNTVEKLVETYPNNGHIETEKHWEAALLLFDLWRANFPHEYKTFYTDQKRLKSLQNNKHGSAKEKDAELQHVLEIPKTYYQLLKGLFTTMVYNPTREEWRQRDIDDQLRDKKFVMKLTKRIPILQIPEKI